MAKSDAHVGYVGRVRASDGVVVGGDIGNGALDHGACHGGFEQRVLCSTAQRTGTFIAPILRSGQRLNTFRMKGSECIGCVLRVAVKSEFRTSHDLFEGSALQFDGESNSLYVPSLFLRT